MEVQEVELLTVEDCLDLAPVAGETVNRPIDPFDGTENPFPMRMTSPSELR